MHSLDNFNVVMRYLSFLYIAYVFSRNLGNICGIVLEGISFANQANLMTWADLATEDGSIYYYKVLLLYIKRYTNT